MAGDALDRPMSDRARCTVEKECDEVSGGKSGTTPQVLDLESGTNSPATMARPPTVPDRHSLSRLNDFQNLLPDRLQRSLRFYDIPNKPALLGPMLRQGNRALRK